MKSVACVADVHVGNHQRMAKGSTAGVNDRCATVLDTLRGAVEHASEAGCAAFIVAGDLLDVRKPEPQVLAAVQELFRQAAPMTVVLLRGNHECVSAAKGDHALGPLRPVAEVVEVPTRYRVGDLDLLCVPYRPGVATAWLPEAVTELVEREPKLTGKRRALVLHLGISDERTPPWLRNASDSVPVELVRDLCERHGIPHVYAGNWHDRREWNYGKGRKSIRVTQIGALCPTGFDNPGFDGYGSVDILTDSGASESVEIPGPRFIKTTPRALEKLTDLAGCYVQIVAPAEELVATRQAATQSAVLATAAGYEVIGDKRESAAMARTAAGAASSADTLDAALARYVDRMQLDETVDRKAVHAKAKELLG